MYDCVCGHVEDEHEGRFFKKCKLPGCDCEDYEDYMGEEG